QNEDCRWESIVFLLWRKERHQEIQRHGLDVKAFAIRYGGGVLSSPGGTDH
ncbi:hypothetical protein TNCT_30381, partial [Trichonephila clavata]